MYGIRNCDTVKKARAWLDERGVEYRFHDYKLAGIDVAQLSRWCAELGWEALVNRAGTTFRKLSSKRPVVELRGKLIVGFEPELYESIPW
jgi:arsenate reductase (glutaredoxin)